MRFGAASIAMAFLLGTLGGARAWDTLRAHNEEAAARSVVDLTARLRSMPYIEAGERTSVQVHVQFENDGPETVRIKELSILGPGYAPNSDDDKPLVVQSDSAVTRRISLDFACDEIRAATVQVRVQVETVGDSREILLPLVDDERNLARSWPLVCQPDDALWLQLLGDDANAIVKTAEGMRVPVWFESSSQPPTTITSIRAASTQLDVVADALPIEVLGGMFAYAKTFVTWRVQDCTAAATLNYDDLNVVVSGSRAGHPPTESTVALDPDLALDIAAYVRSMCSQR